MEKVIICEGFHDLCLLDSLLEHLPGEKGRKSFRLRRDGKQLKTIPDKLSGKKEEDKESEETLPSLAKQGVCEEEIALFSCGGLDGILLFLENASMARVEDYRKVPILVIHDQDDGNTQSETTIECIECYLNGEKLENDEKPLHKDSKIFSIKPMPEGLVLEYLDSGESCSEENFGNKEAWKKSFACYQSFMKCLERKPNELHPKRALGIVEAGVLSQISASKNTSSKNLDKDDKIIPAIFTSIDFQNKCCKGLRKKLDEFIAL